MKKLLYLVLVAPLLFVACNQDEIATFDSDKDGIYFQTGGQTRFFINIDQYRESVRFTFSTSDVSMTDTVLSARLRTMGKVRDYDRKVRVVVDAEGTTAIEGTHFRIDYDKIFIPAGESEVQVPVTFLRTPDLRTTEYRLMLKVEDNENFTVPFKWQKNTNVYYAAGDTIMADRFLFVFNEFYKEPEIWSMFGENPWGAWSVAKQRVMSELFGLTPFDWSLEGWSSGNGKLLPARYPYFAVKLRNYLQAMADAGTPVREEDGSFMQLGSGYEVDYSNCL